MTTRLTLGASFVMVLAVIVGWNVLDSFGALSARLDYFRDPIFTLEAARVDRVIDGDTIAFADGSKVRLAGIDTPERGECGYDDWSSLLETLIAKGIVSVVLIDEDTDRFGRLLGYVDLPDGADTGLAQIEGGLGVARYDARDGYGTHPREDNYVDADVATAHVCSGWD